MTRILKTIRMAVRNLARNGRRTRSTVLAIVVGMVGLALLDGYVTYSMNSLEEATIRSGTGHLQLAASPAFYDEGDVDPFPFMLRDAPAVERELRAMPEVSEVMPALSFTAVLDSKGTTSTVMVTALPVAAAKAKLEARHIAAGADLEASDSGSILVGAGLAKKLGLKPGDAVSLFAQTKGGGIDTQSYVIKGTTSTIIAALDNVSVAMSLEDGQSLIGTDTVPQLIVFLNKTSDTKQVLGKLKAAAPPSAAAGLEVRSWEELSPYYRQANSTYQMVLGVAKLIVLIVALFSISGTLSLSVLERLREIGSLRAFGTKRSGVLAMFVTEGLMLGAAGAVAGVAAGIGVASLINALGGIVMPPQPGTTSAFTILFTPRPEGFVQNALFVLLAAALGSILPGMLSSRKTIAELLTSK
ncbi:MAG: ABC transporter permease [Rectinemataceae bacterium]